MVALFGNLPQILFWLNLPFKYLKYLEVSQDLSARVTSE